MKGAAEVLLVLLALDVIALTICYVRGASVRQLARFVWLVYTFRTTEAVELIRKTRRTR